MILHYEHARVNTTFGTDVTGEPHPDYGRIQRVEIALDELMTIDPLQAAANKQYLREKLWPACTGDIVLTS